jgi:hypothetical protein
MAVCMGITTLVLMDSRGALLGFLHQDICRVVAEAGQLVLTPHTQTPAPKEPPAELGGQLLAQQELAAVLEALAVMARPLV